MGGDWFRKTSVMKFFPAVVADLDYRMMYQNGQHNHVFKRTLCDNNTVYQLQGEGKPFILLHGLLSDGEDLIPLAQELHEKLVNLYGSWIFQVWGVLLLNEIKSSKYLFECSEKVIGESYKWCTSNWSFIRCIYSSGSIGTRVHR